MAPTGVGLAPLPADEVAVLVATELVVETDVWLAADVEEEEEEEEEAVVRVRASITNCGSSFMEIMVGVEKH